MKMIKLGKDGKMTELTKKEMYSSILNSSGYAILALLILSFFMYIVSPYLYGTITFSTALILATTFSIIKEYLFAMSSRSFIVKSLGYSITLYVLLWILQYGM